MRASLRVIAGPLAARERPRRAPGWRPRFWGRFSGRWKKERPMKLSFFQAELKEKLGYAPYGAVLQLEPADVARKTPMDLLTLQLLECEGSLKASLKADAMLEKRVKRQEREEAAKGRVSMTIADSREVQQMTGARPRKKSVEFPET